MKVRMMKPLLLTLALAVVLASSAMAVPVNYGTGIHHWVKSCDLGNGAGTAEYVGASSCPPYVVLPPNFRSTIPIPISGSRPAPTTVTPVTSTSSSTSSKRSSAV
jgi:hypothetical protein